MPLFAEAGFPGMQPIYVLSLGDPGAGVGVDGMTLAFLVMTREEGCLWALPEGSVLDARLEAGQLADQFSMIGPSITVEVAAAALAEESPLMDPLNLPGRKLQVTLINTTMEILSFVEEVVDHHDLEGVVPFTSEDPKIIPLPEDLIAAAQGWLMSQSNPDRLLFYSAQEEEVEVAEQLAEEGEVELIPGTPRRRRSGVQDKPREQAPKKTPRATVASLAEALASIQSVLPQLSSQMQDLSERTARIESGAVNALGATSRPSALKKPLATSVGGGSSNAAPLGAFGERHATAQKYIFWEPAYISGHSTEGGRGGSAGVERGRRERLGKSGPRAKQSPDAVGWPDSFILRRSYDRSGCQRLFCVFKGGNRESKASAGASIAQRSLLPIGAPADVKKDGPCHFSRPSSSSTTGSGGDGHEVPRKVRGLRKVQGARLHCLASGHGDGLHNMLPFAFPESWFQGFDELEVFYKELREPTSREKHGDQLGRRRTPLLVGQCLDFVYVGFKSLFQGDHLGVEYALQSHSSLLEWGGLSEGRVIKRNCSFPVLAAFPVISRGIASRLAGNWTSVLMFRRCLTCILDGVFQLGNTSAATADEVITLPRSIAEELVLASIASFLAVADVSVPYMTRRSMPQMLLHGGELLFRPQ